MSLMFPLNVFICITVFTLEKFLPGKLIIVCIAMFMTTPLILRFSWRRPRSRPIFYRWKCDLETLCRLKYLHGVCLFVSLHFLQSVIPPAMSSPTFVNMECSVGLYLQAEEHQFHHLLLPNYHHICRGVYSPSLVFIGKLLNGFGLRADHPVCSK
jgi:hypothetical protein